MVNKKLMSWDFNALTAQQKKTLKNKANSRFSAEKYLNNDHAFNGYGYIGDNRYITRYRTNRTELLEKEEKHLLDTVAGYFEDENNGSEFKLNIDQLKALQAFLVAAKKMNGKLILMDFKDNLENEILSVDPKKYIAYAVNVIFKALDSNNKQIFNFAIEFNITALKCKPAYQYFDIDFIKRTVDTFVKSQKDYDITFIQKGGELRPLIVGNNNVSALICPIDIKGKNKFTR